MKKTLLILMVGLVFLVGCTQDAPISSFEECVEAGNPVMESYPRQCSADGQTFVEDVELPQDLYQACELLGGNALPEFDECEMISQAACEQLGGEFLECESACRNDPDYPDVICTMQCVQVCVFE